MAYTGHGHHIPGTIKGEPSQISPARCGGVKMCPRCKQDVEDYRPSLRAPVIENPTDNRRKIETLVRQYTDAHYLGSTLRTQDGPPPYEVFIISYEHLLHNWRAIVATDLLSLEGLHFVITYDSEMKQTRVTVYRLHDNFIVPDKE